MNEIYSKRRRKSVIVRVDRDHKDMLDEVTRKLKEKSGFKVSIPNASKFVTMKIRKGKFIPFWFD